MAGIFRSIVKARIIKSLQRGTITIAAGANNTQTATITSVDTAKSLLWHLGVETSGGAGGDPSAVRLTLTNATTITATRAGADTNTPASVVAYQVAEYY